MPRGWDIRLRFRRFLPEKLVMMSFKLSLQMLRLAARYRLGPVTRCHSSVTLHPDLAWVRLQYAPLPRKFGLLDFPAGRCISVSLIAKLI